MENYSTPKNKKENYKLYHLGVYGNHLLFWESLDSFYKDVELKKYDITKPIALRTKTTPGIILPNYCTQTKVEDIESIVTDWTKNYNIEYKDIVLNEIGPDDYILIQGEVCRSINHYDLQYTRAKKIMREALAVENIHAKGLKALCMLKTHMDAASYDNLQRLLDLFPEGIIEFSTYSKCVGHLNLNTVFWEVRNY